MMTAPATAKNVVMSGMAKKPEHNTLAIVQETVGNITGVEPAEVTLDSDLEQDLGIDMITEFTAIITQLKKRIPELASVRREQFSDCLTIAELVEMIDEERDL